MIHGNLDPDHIKALDPLNEDIVKVHGYPMAPTIEKSMTSVIPMSTNVSFYVAPGKLLAGAELEEEGSDIYSLGQILKSCLGRSKAIPSSASNDDLQNKF